MHTQLTRIVRGWEFSGGRLCLDFTNTLGGRRPAGTGGREYEILEEKLDSYANLVDWAEAVGILPHTQAVSLAGRSATRHRAAGEALNRAKALRESLYRIFLNTLQGGKPAGRDMEVLNRESRAARHHRKLVHIGKKFVYTFESNGPRLDSLLWPVAISATDLLLSGNLSRVRQCPGPNCGWLFYDESKNGSRLWCNMRTCGTLEKVRRYRKRQKTG